MKVEDCSVPPVSVVGLTFEEIKKTEGVYKVYGASPAAMLLVIHPSNPHGRPEEDCRVLYFDGLRKEIFAACTSGLTKPTFRKDN